MPETRLLLDGTWEFLHLADDRHSGPAEIRRIAVPGPWQAQFQDLRMRAGIGLYRRMVEIPEGWLAERVFIRFGAVLHEARVFVNGDSVGSHRDGALPFSFDVTRSLRPGPNEIKVRVDSPSDRAGQAGSVSRAGQAWYGPLSGIWQTVLLERRVADHMAGLRLTPQPETGRVEGSLRFAAPLAGEAEIRVAVTGPDGDVVARTMVTAEASGTELAFDLAVAGVRLWSPDQPALYRADLVMARQGGDVDAITQSFGFRTVTLHGGRLHLNGEPFHVRAALDLSCYPETLCTVPSLDFLEDQARKAKSMGLNALRLQAAMTDPRCHEVADRLGLVLLADLPEAPGRELLRGIVDRDGHHPSIVAWLLAGEPAAEDGAAAFLREIDRTRLVLEDGVPPIHEGGGAWGLPHPADLESGDGREPWWFETGHDWGDGMMYAHAVENRFADWSLDRVFGDLGRFVVAAQWRQFAALKREIESARRDPHLAGSVVSALHDCHWQSSGLLDMHRNPRVFHELLPTVNADTVVLPRPERLSWWAGESLGLEVAIAHGAGPALEGGKLHVRLGEAGLVLDLPRLDAPAVRALGRIALPVPEANEPALRRLHLDLRRADGGVAATNHFDVAVYPRRARPAETGERVWSREADLLERFGALGYREAGGPDEATLIVARRHDEATAERVRGGAQLLLLPEDEASLFPFFPHWQEVGVRARKGTVWRRDGSATFSWLRRSGPFARIPGGPLLDETMERLEPETVISGCNLLDFQSRVFAGLVVGWVHKPAALGVERSYGRGRLVATTFRLLQDPPLADPAATALMDALVGLPRGSRASRPDRRVGASEAAA